MLVKTFLGRGSYCVKGVKSRKTETICSHYSAIAFVDYRSEYCIGAQRYKNTSTGSTLPPKTYQSTLLLDIQREVVCDPLHLCFHSLIPLTDWGGSMLTASSEGAGVDIPSAHTTVRFVV